jgi:16S rRNA (adenine1518-N6/adenine1519-N6)-dimethyltransferase
LVQREVADRIVAPPGSKEYGALSVNVQAVAVPRILFRVAPGSFQPPPKVESAVVRIDPRPDPEIEPEEEGQFRRFVQEVFGMRRKQLQRILRTLWTSSSDDVDAALRACGIEPSARPETLSVRQFAAVFRRRH